MSATLPGGQHAEPCDVLVIGDVPAGATIGAWRAPLGLPVVAAKAHRPRCPIGESLPPARAAGVSGPLQGKTVIAAP